MLNMSSQDTRRKVRLNEKVESRVRGDLYARFGGEYLETYYCKKWQGAGCLAYEQYKNHWSDFRSWAQLSHAEDWLLFPGNVGPFLSIDETDAGDL